ncbi:MAG: hypothetical protein DMG99_09900 [Acidobacteria bacterium]|nr:MAG: hypothetical protein DMG99_09900 [Acidobacteriota bacterium]
MPRTPSPAGCAAAARNGAHWSCDLLRNSTYLSGLGYTGAVVSLRFRGVRFIVFSNDHPPRHIHGFHGETEAIVDLRRDRTIALGKRADAVRPANAKRSDVKKILKAAAARFDDLAALWEAVHGETSDCS